MKNRYQFILITILLLSLSFNSLGQNNDTNNIVRIAKSYVEFQLDTFKNISEDYAVILISAISIDKDSIRLGISFVPAALLFDMEYDKVYEFEGFKLLIVDKLDKSYMLKKLFKETAYTKFEKVGVSYSYHPKDWSVTLNNKNEVVSVESVFRFKDVVRKLKKNKVKLASNFHFIQNMSWQTGEID